MFPASEVRAPLGMRTATTGICSKESGMESSRMFILKLLRKRNDACEPAGIIPPANDRIPHSFKLDERTTPIHEPGPRKCDGRGHHSGRVHFHSAVGDYAPGPEQRGSAAGVAGCGSAYLLRSAGLRGIVRGFPQHRWRVRVSEGDI